MKTMFLILSKLVFLIIASIFFFGNVYINHDFLTMKSTLKPISTLSPILDKVIPSVVSIKIEGYLHVKEPYIYQRFKPFFSKQSPFCNNLSPFDKSILCKGLYGRKSHNEKFQALGSGVILDSEKGYIITNNHVIEHANKIKVFLNDGSQYIAKIVGKDIKLDIALIQLQNIKKLISIKLANSDLLRVGDYTIAIGNPYGLGETVTSGIISALGRNNLKIGDYANFIQTDAAINRGNSGGALINLKGELIGINTAILAPNGGNIGIGFAIPGNTIKKFLDQISSLGCIKNNTLGIIGVNICSKLNKINNFHISQGVFIKQVLPYSSAEKIGIRAGDILLYLNKKQVFGASDLRSKMDVLPFNSTIKLVILRNKKCKIFFIKLNSDTGNISSTLLLKDITASNLYNYHLNKIKGIYIHIVQSNTTVNDIGLKKNDIIVEINKHVITNIKQLKDIIKKIPSILIFKIKRHSSHIYLVSKLK